MAEVRWITNLEGILYYLETPLLDFQIRNRKLVRAKALSEGRFYPPELALYGVTYANLNEFFQRRTMKEGCMLYREHLKAVGMQEKFDFDRYIRLNNGNNHLDNYWVRFADGGARSFRELMAMDKM